MSVFALAETCCSQSQRLGWIAMVSPKGQSRAVPVRFRCNPELAVGRGERESSRCINRPGTVRGDRPFFFRVAKLHRVQAGI